MEILIAILILGTLGLLFGIGLAIASKKLAVEVNPKLEEVQHLLPGSNCGACGNPGCFGFAESLVSGKNVVEGCRVCNDESKEKIAKIEDVLQLGDEIIVCVIGIDEKGRVDLSTKDALDKPKDNDRPHGDFKPRDNNRPRDGKPRERRPFKKKEE